MCFIEQNRRIKALNTAPRMGGFAALSLDHVHFRHFVISILRHDVVISILRYDTVTAIFWD